MQYTTCYTNLGYDEELQNQSYKLMCGLHQGSLEEGMFSLGETYILDSYWCSLPIMYLFIPGQKGDEICLQ